MRYKIITGLFLLLIAVSTVTPFAYYKYINSLTQSAFIVKHDPRVSSLASFFGHYKCPTPYYVKEYLQIADKYGLDYRLLPAISIQESTCGKHELYNNWFGIGSSSSLEHYTSPIQGIERAAQVITKYGLKHYGPNQDKYPLEIKAIEEQIK